MFPPIPFSFSLNPIATILRSLFFYAPRTSSITQTRGAGTPTETRATVATVMGYGPTATIADGQTLLTVASGELRFQGARRVSEGVWSNVDADGAPIPAATLKGALVEAEATNTALQSQTLDNVAWSIVSGADMNAVVADAYVAPDGTTTMDKLQPKATASTHVIRQSNVSVSAGISTYSIYARYDSQRWICLVIYDGTTLNYASFDLLNGVAGAVSAGVTSKIYSTGLSGVYRVALTMTTLASAAGQVYVSMNNTNTAGLETWTPAGTELLGLWGAQVELGSYATAYIPTTTTAVTRNKDVLDDQVASNLTAAAGTVAFTWTPSHDPSGTIALCGSYVDASNYTMVLAQKVTNLILGSSDDITASPWGLNGVPTSVTASSITFSASATNGVANPSITAAATGAQVFIIKCKAWTDSGTKQFRLQITKPSVANYTSSDFTATTTPTDFYYVATTAAGAASTDAYIINSSDSSTGKVNFSEIVVEDVTNNVSQFPAPYVSTATGTTTFAIFRKVIAGAAYDAYIQHAYVSGTTYDIACAWGASGINLAVDGTLGTAHANTTAAQLGTRWQWGADGNLLQQAGAAFKEMYLTPRTMSDAELQAITV